MATFLGSNGGQSNVLADLLWRAYMHFPLSGSWDWVLLFVSLSVVMRLLLLPFLWQAVAADVKLLESRSTTATTLPRQAWVPAFWGLGSLGLFLWFFQTSASWVFLDRREFLGLSGLHSPDSRVFLFSIVAIISLLGAVTQIDDNILPGTYRVGFKATKPFAKRDLRCLQCGGGVFVRITGGKPVALSAPVTGFWESLGVALLHVCYWKWSIASVVLMHAFVLGSVVTEIFRLLFVYVLHKRTFG